ncbi:P-loop NTPase family protein [Flindersiella endophytica]
MARIEAAGLRKTYGSKVAVEDLSFTVEPGVVTGFLGPNGAGKSTTMRLMLELDHGSGQTLFDGRRYSALRHPMRQVGAVLEAKAFHPTRQARHHLRMMAAGNGIPSARVDEVLRSLGLTEVATAKPKTFSLGMGQRLGLAVALLGDPHTLILDEPANGLDPQGINWLRGFLKAFAAEGKSVLVSSHLLSEMGLLADRLVVIGRGRLIASGSLQEFIGSVSETTVFVRTPEPQRLHELLTAAGATVQPLDGGGFDVTGMDQIKVSDIAFNERVQLHELTTRTPSLEDAFLRATGGSQEFVAQLIGAPGSVPLVGMGPGGPPPGQPGPTGQPGPQGNYAAPQPPNTPGGAA